MTNLIDTSGAPLSNSEAANKEVKLSPLFFLSEESRAFLKQHGTPVTNRDVEASFKAWMELPSKYQAELNFLALMMPR